MTKEKDDLNPDFVESLKKMDSSKSAVTFFFFSQATIFFLTLTLVGITYMLINLEEATIPRAVMLFVGLCLGGYSWVYATKTFIHYSGNVVREAEEQAIESFKEEVDRDTVGQPCGEGITPHVGSSHVKEKKDVSGRSSFSPEQHPINNEEKK